MEKDKKTKKALWWILGILLSPLLLFAALTALLYMPPVQNWAVDKATAIASEKTGMPVSIDYVRLAFPLDLELDGIRAADNHVERLTVDVRLLPLFSKRVVIDEFSLTNARIDTDTLIAAARVKGTVASLQATSRGIDLDAQTVELNGTLLDNARLEVWLNDSVPEDTTTTETLWKISIDSVAAMRTDVTLHMPGDSMSVVARFGRLSAGEALIDLGSETYTVGSAQWAGGSLAYDQNFEPRVEGLDFNHIDLTDISIGIDSIYYHDPTLRLQLRQVALKEKSGMSVEGMSGTVAMENGSIRLPAFRLKTPASDIFVDLDMPLSLTDSINPGSMKLKMEASLGREDLMLFMGDLPKGVLDRWPLYPLEVKGTVSGNMERMDFSSLNIALPTAFSATATGHAANLTDMERLTADVTFDATTQNMAFLTAALPRDMQRDYRLPAMTASGRLKADARRYSADVTLREGRGTVKASGTFNERNMSYDVKATVSNLNVHHFMPRDSIYTVTADISAKGHGTDFLSPRTVMTADARLHHLQYGSMAVSNVGMAAELRNGHAIATVDSRNELLSGVLGIDALLNSKKLIATVSADVSSADLQKMGVMEFPLTLALCGSADITSDMKLDNYVSALISDIIIRDSSDTFRSEFVGMHLRTSADTTLLRAQSGDLIVKLDASGNYHQVADQLSCLADTVMMQLEKKTIDQPAMRRLLPVMKMHVESRQNNPVANLLKSGKGIWFRDMFFDLSTSPVTGINGKGNMLALNVGGVRLDTINFSLTQRKERLSFGGQICNNRKNPQFVFNALFDGVLQEHGATFGVRYFDAAGKMGARLGAQAQMVADGINIHLVPARPTLGYKEFNLNSDNFILLRNDGKIRASVNLIADDRTGMKIYSEDSDSTVMQDITLSLNHIDLAEITSVLPYAPQMSGQMDGDFHVIQDNRGLISVAGDMGARKLVYENSEIGNVSTEMVYLQKGDTAHAVEARLMKDDIEVGLLTGTYYDKGDGYIDANLLLERFPLSMVNGFVPDQMVGLEGYGVGEMTVKGSLSAPVVNGKLQMDSAYLVSVPYGMRLRVDDTPAYITASTLILENFKVHAPQNETPLTVNGSIDFSNLERILVNLRMRARNYMVINAKERPNSVAFGKAFVNVFALIKGQLDNLNMRGRLEVLGSTDLNYILRDSPLTTDNQLDELVKFTDFSDSTQTVVEQPPVTGFTMDMTVQVSQGAHIMAYMNADHSNYIDLMGGGTLRMRYSSADDLQLYGKYTLSNGEMKYSLPVIPLKTFNIQDGSYIEFTGEPMNPTLNIAAVERTNATVTDAGGVGRSVNFDCGVSITKTLSSMGLEFTLDAPEDMQLHSELQAMSVEQRGKLAVSMLTTGMYLSDGNTGSFSMNSALSSFLNSEISQITGNALRTLDMQFGMDNTTDATGDTHTDYSFKFAKRFFNNRLKIAVGGKVSSGDEMQQRNNSFFDNVTMEYRLDDSANKYVSLFYQNNSYDWLDGYTEKYGGGFIWRRSLQRITDIFRLKTDTNMPLPSASRLRVAPADSTRTDSTTVKP